MSCTLTTGIGLGCKDSVGGVKEFYIANKSTGDTITQNASGEVTAITVSGSWYRYTPRTGTSSYTDQPIGNREQGTFYAEQSATMVFNTRTQAKRNEIIKLGKANVYIIAKDQTDRLWLLGQDNGLELASSESGSGVQLSERNGYSLVFEGMEADLAPLVNSGAFSISSTVL